ncbi:unnamed protein product [Mytilus edulis]|uniref:Uncharacterized protein n=1 Tax=Mytilus edulis TaxID=6550 RepID=A0A8S3R3T3_MYTED|nr:unnamed protein product [Mytilus edulis]
MIEITKNLKFCLGFLIVGFLIHFAAFTMPFWNFFEENDLMGTQSFRLISIGLWQACFKMGGKYWCQGYTAYSGFTVVRLFECLSLVGYVTSIVLFIVYHQFPVYGTRIFIANVAAIVTTVVTSVVGILCWATGCGTTVQHNLSLSFALVVISLIFPILSIWCLVIERITQVEKIRRDSLSQPEKTIDLI